MPDIAVVTGGARGIGRAIGVRLAGDGYRVVLLDVLSDVLDTAAEIPGAHAEVLDIRDEQAVGACFDGLAADARLAVLVNCAATCSRTGFAEFTVPEWRRELDVNLTGTFITCKAAIFPHMRAQAYGRIVNVASVSGKLGGIGTVRDAGGRSGPAYAASKAGVINLTRWIARDVGRWGITCNAVAPGPIGTRMTETLDADHEFGSMPVQRFGRPEEVADAVGYLAAPERGFTTGTCLHVDGGTALA